MVADDMLAARVDHCPSMAISTYLSWSSVLFAARLISGATPCADLKTSACHRALQQAAETTLSTKSTDIQRGIEVSVSCAIGIRMPIQRGPQPSLGLAWRAQYDLGCRVLDPLPQPGLRPSSARGVSDQTRCTHAEAASGLGRNQRRQVHGRRGMRRRCLSLAALVGSRSFSANQSATNLTGRGHRCRVPRKCPKTLPPAVQHQDSVCDKGQGRV